jgi:hypothetical protein
MSDDEDQPEAPGPSMPDQPANAASPRDPRLNRPSAGQGPADPSIPANRGSSIGRRHLSIPDNIDEGEVDHDQFGHPNPNAGTQGFTEYDFRRRGREERFREWEKTLFDAPGTMRERPKSWNDPGDSPLSNHDFLLAMYPNIPFWNGRHTGPWANPSPAPSRVAQEQQPPSG